MEAVTARPPAARPRKRIPALLALAALAAIGVFAGKSFRSASPPLVPVSFVTHPFEATIWLDGRQLLDTGGSPYTTPCTVEGLPARTHHVVYWHAERGTLDAGPRDFARERRIEGRWDPRP